nr:hypothetical protein [Sphingopyxis flava]
MLHRHPAVSVAAVVAKPNERWGEVPCAFLELRDGMEVDAASMALFCRKHLAGFKVPKHFVFGTIPKTATGKMQKFVLRKMAVDFDVD